MKVLDLFSGIGGFSLGLERAGFETAAFCEIDPHAQKVLKKHWPDTPIFEDIKSLFYSKGDASKYLADGETAIQTDIDIICGGFPCQDISVAGKQKGLEGERSGLWREFKRLIEEIRPKYAIIENVANLRSKGLATVLQDLDEIGYDAEFDIVSAAGVGGLHKRERIWIIAYPKSAGAGIDQSRIRRHADRASEERRRNPDEEIPESAIPNASILGLDGCPGQERHLQTDQEWDSQEIHSEGTEREPELRPTCEILSRRRLESFRASIAEQWEPVSRVRRIVNGLSKGMERSRKQRIKQLGNAVVPQIPQFIGEAIMDREIL